MIGKIISGGQTGVDRAALDAALERGIPCGGWCPRGRLAEDGPIPDHYPLVETPSSGYSQRTSLNVRDSDGTLVLVAPEVAGGTKLTVEEATRQGRPLLVVDLTAPFDPQAVRAWVEQNHVGCLNVAGPRESESPSIYTLAYEALIRVLSM